MAHIDNYQLRQVVKDLSHSLNVIDLTIPKVTDIDAYNKLLDVAVEIAKVHSFLEDISIQQH